MSFPQFSDGTKRLLREHVSLPPSRTRELGLEFVRIQARVCRSLARLAYPLNRLIHELQSGHLPYFREGSDQDRKEGGKKTGYRFAGISPSLGAEYFRQAEARRLGEISMAALVAWEEEFLRRFTFELVEQVALRALPAPVAPGEGFGAELRELRASLAAARRMRDQILTGNLLLAAQIAIRRGQFQRGFTLDDLFAAGLDGLLIAINRYDPAVALFSTYATPWISMAIDRYAANNRHVIRLPIGLQDKVRRLGDAAPSLIPSTVSLEEPLGGEREGCVADLVADPAGVHPQENLEQSDLARRLGAGVASLGGLKEFIVALRSEVGDASALAADLFRQEAKLSLSRGRATALAAAGTLDQPARIRLLAPGVLVSEPALGGADSEPLPLAVAV